MRAAILTIIGLSTLPTIAAAGSSGSNSDIEQPIDIANTSPGELLGNMVWVMVALAIVITLIILVIKWLSRRNQLWGANRSMRSLGGIALGQNSSIQVVEIGGRVYIVGVGQQITLIDKFLDAEEAAELIASLDNQSNTAWSPKDLTNMVKQWRNRHSAQPEPGKEQWNSSSSSFEQMLQNKLNKQSDRKQQLEDMLQDQNKNERLMEHEK
ncbi:flagellar biosynthetic protein FliO [Paenibacillus sp. NPDC057967]|uniref:flagellar biosynthetic protein FliO n=1 Tax=Paenibacillus sp. NPDC057967 TaxID=3346293 RepID=UPI0036D9FBF7